MKKNPTLFFPEPFITLPMSLCRLWIHTREPNHRRVLCFDLHVRRSIVILLTSCKTNSHSHELLLILQVFRCLKGKKSNAVGVSHGGKGCLSLTRQMALAFGCIYLTKQWPWVGFYSSQCRKKNTWSAEDMTTCELLGHLELPHCMWLNPWATVPRPGTFKSSGEGFRQFWLFAYISFRSKYVTSFWSRQRSAVPLELAYFIKQVRFCSQDLPSFHLSSLGSASASYC